MIIVLQTDNEEILSKIQKYEKHKDMISFTACEAGVVNLYTADDFSLILKDWLVENTEMYRDTMVNLIQKYGLGIVVREAMSRTSGKVNDETGICKSIIFKIFDEMVAGNFIGQKPITIVRDKDEERETNTDDESYTLI